MSGKAQIIYSLFFLLLFSVIFTDGVNVDWPGWCFDDDEVLDNLYPLEEDLHQGIGGPVYSWDVQEYSQQEDGECSQV